MKVITAVYLICCIITVATYLPATRSLQSWPCQRDKDVRMLLSNALVHSRVLAGQIFVLSNTMERQWPTDPYKESNVDFIVPLRSFNETTDTPKQILRANCRILRTFMKQLNRLQVAEGLVASKITNLKTQTKTLISHLRKIVTIIPRRGKRNSSPHGGQQRNSTVSKPGSRPLPKPTTRQDVLLKTKLILNEFYANIVTLVTDLSKIKGITCN